MCLLWGFFFVVVAAAAVGFSKHFVTKFSINKIHMRYNTSRSRIFKVVFV